MERRLLSVIIPMYNAEKFIASMIKAIQNQSYTNFEVIIVDDQSTDNSVEVVKKRHYKIFCVNVKYGIQYGFRIFYLIALQNEENYEREESCSA